MVQTLSKGPILHFYYSQLFSTTAWTAWKGGFCPASSMVMVATGQPRPLGNEKITCKCWGVV